MNARKMSRLALVTIVGATLSAGVPAVHAAGYRGYDVPIPSVAQKANGLNVDVIENLGDTVPRDLAFVDGHGAPVKLSQLLGQGKPLLLTLGYYGCPMLCNLTHEGLAKALKQADLKLGRDFLGLAVSIDPNEDPKSANTNQGRLLRSIVPDYLVGPENDAAVRRQWPFVMGAGAAKQLADKVGFRYYYDKQSKQFAHTAAAFVLTPEGKIARYLYGPEFTARDLRLALVEAGGGRVGTSLDKILVTCFKYDPMAKKYTPFVSAFVRIGAFMSFLALAALMGSLWWKELKMRKEDKAARLGKVPA